MKDLGDFHDAELSAWTRIDLSHSRSSRDIFATTLQMQISTRSQALCQRRLSWKLMRKLLSFCNSSRVLACGFCQALIRAQRRQPGLNPRLVCQLQELPFGSRIVC